MAGNSNFTRGIGRLATDRYDFQNHTDGYNAKHNADKITVIPALTLNEVVANDVYTALQQIGIELGVLELSGKGFITVGDGYDTYRKSNPEEIDYDANAPYDATVPAFNTYLDNLLNITDPLNVNYNHLHVRIRDGGVVLIKSGTYKFTGSVNVPPGIILMGEGYGTKIVNQTAGTIPLFNILADTLRQADNAIDGTDRFMFSKETIFLNLTLADNFLIPKFLGDTSHYVAINAGTSPLVETFAGSSFTCENVKFIGRQTTCFAIKLNSSLLQTTPGSSLKVNNSFIDGFAQPIYFPSVEGRYDHLEVTNSKVRAYGNLGAPASSSPATIFGADLVHLWDDYDGTTWTDNGSVPLPATPQTNAPTQATVNGHNYPVFHGINDGMENATTDTAMDNLSSWTFFWVFKTNFGDAFGAIVDHAQQYYMELKFASGSPTISIQGFGNPALDGVTDISDNQWHRVIVTVNSLAAELYIDGSLDASVTFLNALPPAANPTLLGVQPGGSVTDSAIAIVGAATRGMTGPEIALLDQYLIDYITPPVASEETDCMIRMNDNNALISDNIFYGSHPNLYTICYIKSRIATPAIYDTSLISIINNDFLGDTTALLNNAKPVVIDAAIISTPTAFSDNAKIVTYGNNYSGSATLFKIGVDGNELVQVAKNTIALNAATSVITTSPTVTTTATTATINASSTASINATTLAEITAGQIEETATNDILLTAIGGNITALAGTDISATATAGDITVTATAGAVGITAAAGFGLIANGNLAFTNSIIEVAENDISIESTAGGYSLVTFQDISLAATTTVDISSSTTASISGATAINLTSPNITSSLASTTIVGTNNISFDGAIYNKRAFAVTTTPYVVDTTNASIPDYIILVDTSTMAITIDLPAHVLGRTLIIKDAKGNASVNNITLVRSGATGNIDDYAGNRTISSDWSSLTLWSDGTNWLFI